MHVMKEANLERLHTVNPTIRHAGKGKTIESVKRSVVARGEREGGVE